MAEEGTRAAGLHAPQRQLALLLLDTTVVLLLLTAGYYTFPLRVVDGEPTTVLRLMGSLTLFAVVAWVLVRHSARSRRRLAREFFQIRQLLSVLYLLVLTFALVYAVISFWWPGQIEGIENRTDALYFSVTVISTVGFGDVHATETPSRVVVTIQMLFNLIYIGTAFRVLSNLRTSG